MSSIVNSWDESRVRRDRGRFAPKPGAGESTVQLTGPEGDDGGVGDVEGIFSAAPALGRFRSRSTRDATGLDRDGQDVVAINQLDADTVEVQFRDGEWMLCAPDEVDD